MRKRREARTKELGYKVSREQGERGRSVEMAKNPKLPKKGQREREKRSTAVRRKVVQKRVGKRREEAGKVVVGKRKKKEERRWEEERVRVGTGFRVRWPETQKKEKRVLDIGYGDRKEYKRKEGVEVELAKNNIGRKLKAEGKGARERVMKEVCTRERIRKRSVYTGCGRTRKSRVGKKKLKPTKVRTV